RLRSGKTAVAGSVRLLSLGRDRLGDETSEVLKTSEVFAGIGEPEGVSPRTAVASCDGPGADAARLACTLSMSNSAKAWMTTSAEARRLAGSFSKSCITSRDNGAGHSGRSTSGAGGVWLARLIRIDI